MSNGWLITAAVLIPNLAWMISGGLKQSATAQKKTIRTRIMEIAERAGQAGALATPFFYGIRVRTLAALIALLVLLFSLSLYYSCWLRYFLFGRERKLLYESLFGLPLPMNVLPIVYFLSASILIRSWWLAGFSVILGIGHLYMGRFESKSV